MGAYTRQNTELTVDLEGIGQQHSTVEGGMVISLEHWNAGLDTTEMYADLPGGACQEPHFGYLVSGEATVSYTDGETETLTGGEAYYLRAGHNVRIDQDADFVEFTRADGAPGFNSLDL